MKKKSLLLRLVVLVTAMMCALGAAAAEAYANYTPSNTTLTFYYDNLRSSRTGTTFDLNEGNHQPGWQDDDLSMGITRVVFNSSFASARPKSTYQWFAWMYELQSIVGLNYLNTTEVTTMANMFCGCIYESLDLSHFDTSKVTDMSYMFSNCSVTSLDVSSFNTSKVADMTEMFYCCESLTSIDVSSFNTSNVTSMSKMFSGCSGLTSLDLSSFNTDKVSNMGYMFLICSDLVTIYVGSGWSTSSVTYSTNMFRGCTSLVGGQGTTYDANHIDKAYAHIDGGTSNPGYFTAVQPYAWYTPSNTTLTFCYDAQRSSRPGKTYNLNTGNTYPAWYYDGTYSSVTQVVFNSSFAGARPTTTSDWFFNMENLQSITGLGYLNTSEVTSMIAMFGGCHALTSVDVSGFNTANVTNMNALFYDCPALTSLDVSNFNTAKVTDMWQMFNNCSSLTSLDVSNFNTAKVTQMAAMFNRCSALTSLDLSNFNTAKVTDMSNMFNGCSALTSLNVSNFNTANVTDMSCMFAQCESLNSLDVSNFNTAKVSNMNCMFMYLRSLTHLDLSSFNTSNVTEMAEMFLYCPLLKTIYVSDSWTTAAVTSSSDMFYGCYRLTGQMGTTYNSFQVDKAYAHIDGGTSNPGYFTAKPEAYACYTPSNTTLTFYYDSQRSSRTGTTYDLNEGSNDTGWETDGTNASVTKVVFDPSFAGARPTSTCGWFYGMGNLESITGMSYLNTSEVTNMNWMFLACSKLTSLDVSHFNTSKVMYMDQLFSVCTGLTSLDLSSFNTSKVAYMRYMFTNSTNLQTIYVGDGWSTAAVTESINMFLNCTNLVGGKGTTYSSSHVDKAYAHIDGGTSNPGYFTAKNAGQRGDVNGVGGVDMDDLTALINYLLTSNSTGINMANAASCDSPSSTTVDMDDLTALINYLLDNTWP